MASNSLPPIVQRIVVENPQAIPQAMIAAAAATQTASAANTQYNSTLEIASVLQANIATAMQGATAATQAETEAQTAGTIAIQASGAAVDQTAAGMSRLAYSTTEARVAAMSLGVELGVRMPRSLTRFLAQSETFGPILAKAFNAVALLAVVEIVARLPDMIQAAADRMLGFGEAEKKAAEDAIKFSDSMRDLQTETAKKMADVSLIGLEGTAKATAAFGAEKISVAAVTQQLNEHEHSLRKLDAEYQNLHWWEKMAGESNTHVKQVETDMAHVSEIVGRLTEQAAGSLNLPGKVSAETAKLTAESLVAQREAQLRIAESQKSIDLAALTYAEQNARARLADGTYTEEEFTKRMVAQEEKRLEIEKQFIEKKKSLSAEGGFPESGKAAEQATVESSNRTQGILDQYFLKTQQAADSTAKARIESEKQVSDATIRLSEESARSTLESQTQAARDSLEVQTASYEEARSRLQAAAQAKFDADVSAAQKEFDLVKSTDARKAQAEVEYNTKVALADLGLSSERLRIDTDINNKLIEDARRVAEGKKRLIEETVRAQEELGNEQLRIDEQVASTRLSLNEITITKWQQQETEALQKWLIGQLTAIKTAERALEAAHLQESAEYKRLQDQEVLLKRQAAQKQEEIDKQVAQHWHQIQSTILTDFNHTLLSIQKGQVVWQKGFAQLTDSLLLDAEQYFLKLAEQNALHWAVQKIQDITGWGVKVAVDASGAAAAAAAAKASALAQVTTDAGVAAAGTMAYYSAIDPPIAPAMAAIQYAITMAYGSFEKGGVVPHDMIAQVHEGEGVFSRPVMNMIERGSVSTSSVGATNIRNSMTYHNHTGGSGEMTPEQMMKNLTKVLRKRNLNIANLRT